jgi:CHAT domain-containing protein
MLASLPGAEAESRWIAQRLTASVLTGDHATEAAVRRLMPSASIIHLATHGFAYSSEARARDSFIALAPGDGHDGVLTLGEIVEELPPLTAELVVLSACQTALGNLRQAEGTIGLQRAFIAKGVGSVLVSQWNVSDAATELLMRHFYTHWFGGSSKSEALRQAQVMVRGEPGSRFHHPSFWGGFQLVGLD